MNTKDLMTKLAKEKVEALTGKSIELEEVGYKTRVIAFDNTTYQRKELAVVNNRRELVLFLTGIIEGAENGRRLI
ncbi:MAG: hypothetical protein IKS76_01575 [Paludibacteraceae bacterium]|nr:hypothetical protein [Paludibacteraceae bacterium]